MGAIAGAGRSGRPAGHGPADAGGGRSMKSRRGRPPSGSSRMCARSGCSTGPPRPCPRTSCRRWARTGSRPLGSRPRWTCWWRSPTGSPRWSRGSRALRASPAGAGGSSATKPFHRPPRSLAAGAGGSFDASCRSSTRWIVLTAVKGVRPAVVDLAGRLKTSASARRALLKDFGPAPADSPLGQSLARLEAGGEGTTAVRGLRLALHGVGRGRGPTAIRRRTSWAKLQGPPERCDQKRHGSLRRFDRAVATRRRMHPRVRTQW